MKKKAALNTYASIIFIFFGLNIYAQSNTKTIILSENIGPIVDFDEKQKYNILPIFQENFSSAVFMVTPDNNYFCNVTLKDGKTLKDTTLSLGYHSVRNLAFRIYNLDLLEKGYSEIDINSFAFQYSQQSIINSNNITDTDSLSKTQTISISSDLLPIRRDNLNYSELIENKFKIGFSFGIFYNSTNFDRANDIYDLEEEGPLELFDRSNEDFDISPIYKLSSFFIFSHRFMFEMDYIFNINTSIDYENFVLSFNYLFPLRTYINAYAGIGYSAIRFSVLKEYNSSVIESITLIGAEAGIRTSLGIKYSITNLVSFDFRGSYNIYPKIDLNEIENDVSFESPSIDLNGFELGLSLYLNIN